MARQVDLLKGNILRSLTLLALPIMGSQLVQMAYNLTDMIWIGRVGAGAVAAVGAAGMFMWLSNGMAVLPRMGGQVKVAQSIGAGDIEAAGRYAAAALQMGGVMSLVYTVAMFVGAGPLIGFFRLNSAEVEVLDMELYTIKGMLGGMMTPSPPATATMAEANTRSYPIPVRKGMAIAPTAAVVAGPEPEIAP